MIKPNRPTWAPYKQYLLDLAAKRQADGLPPAPDISPQDYWDRRARQRVLDQELHDQSGINQAEI